MVTSVRLMGPLLMAASLMGSCSFQSALSTEPESVAPAVCEDDSCSGRGKCSEVAFHTECACDAGYTGPTCATCDTGYHRLDDACVADAKCTENTCSGHGQCAEVEGRAECTCDEGYAGASCTSCATGFHRAGSDACVADETCKPGTCGDHGTCSDTSGVIVCSCDPGYAGPSCATCYAGYHEEAGKCVIDVRCLDTSCSSVGQCDDLSGAVVCSCDEGYAGTACDSCAEGFHRGANERCVANVACPSSDACENHGTCDDSSGVPVCTCAAGYAGATCGACYPGYHDEAGSCVLNEQCAPSTCSGGGSCSATGGVVSCACFGGYTGTYCADCAVGFHRDETHACVADETCPPSGACSGHGSCSATSGVARCDCDDGYMGTACEACYPGYHEEAGSCVLDERCRDASCGSPGSGSCDDSTGVVVCTCNPGYEGDHCEFNVDDCLNSACGSGQCVDQLESVICLCLDGTYGDSCPDPDAGVI